MKSISVAVLLTASVALAQPAGSIQKAIALYDQARYEEARKLLTPILATSGDPQVAFYLGRLAMRSSSYEEAAGLFEKAIALKPADSEYHVMLADAYGQAAMKSSLFTQARLAGKIHAELEKAVELDPSSIDARLGLIDFYMQAPGFMGGSVEKAKEQAAEIRRRDVKSGHIAWANIDHIENRDDLAEKEWLDWVKAEPSSAKAHYWLGNFRFNNKDYGAASIEFETAVKLDPAWMPAWFQIGRVAGFTGSNPARGEEALTRYLGYQPKKGEPLIARAHYWLGRIFERQGKRELARQSYSESLKLIPGAKEVSEAYKRVGG